MRQLFCLVSVSTLCACSGDVGTSAQNDQPDTPQAVCQASCSRQQRCAPEADGTACVDDCVASMPSPSVYRPGVLASLANCYANLACGTSDDTCASQVIAQVSANPTEDSSFSACMTKHDDCSASGISAFSDDTCTMVFVLTDAAKASFTSCMTRACAEVEPCVDSVLGIAPS